MINQLFDYKIMQMMNLEIFTQKRKKKEIVGMSCQDLESKESQKYKFYSGRNFYQNKE